MKYIRKIIGPIILFFDAITRPRKIKRPAQEQEKVNQQTQNLSLYQYNACPFCVKVRRTMHKLDLPIKLQDAKVDSIANELEQQGGKRKVPCLRIEEEGQTRWMYESNDIVSYLEKTFA